MKSVPPIAFVLFLLLAAVGLACTDAGNEPGNQTGNFTAVSQQESYSVAEDFVRNSPTFRYDGIDETLEFTAVNTLRCLYCWEFVFEFDCRHSGYGDRTGQILAPVITHHSAKVVVVEGDVAHGVLDGQWDMLVQEFITLE